MKKSDRSRCGWVQLIGGFKIFQGVVLFVLAVGILRFINKAVDTEVATELLRLHIDLDSPWVQRLLNRLDHVDNHQLMTLSTGSFVYSLLLFIEGAGLCLEQRWGEYFTVLVTGSFIPFEMYECIHEFSVIAMGVLLLNAAVLVYLIIRVTRKHKGCP